MKETQHKLSVRNEDEWRNQKIKYCSRYIGETEVCHIYYEGQYGPVSLVAGIRFLHFSLCNSMNYTNYITSPFKQYSLFSFICMIQQDRLCMGQQGVEIMGWNGLGYNNQMFDWLFPKKKQQPPKKPKKQQDDNKWKYDLLVQFLCGPEWKNTILNFVDQNCIVFDNEQQNKFSYTEIHNKFKELVAGLFDSMMKDIGLEEEELLTLIARGLQSKSKKLFEQLLICDDFLKFKDIMVRRNKALEMEAMKALSEQGTKSNLIQTPHAPLPARSNFKSEQEMEEQMMRRAIEQSEREEKMRQQRLRMEEQRNIEEQITKSKIAEKKLQEQRQRQQVEKNSRLKQQEEERKRVELQRHREDMQRLKQKEEEKRRQEEKPKPKKQLPPVKQLPPLKARQPTVHIQQPVAVEQPPQQQEKKPEKNAESVEDRKRRLLEQRQILKKKKMEERKKQAQNPDKAKKSETIVLDLNGINDGSKPAEEEPQEKISQDEIERRRNLMKRIKNRIVDDI